MNRLSLCYSLIRIYLLHNLLLNCHFRWSIFWTIEKITNQFISKVFLLWNKNAFVYVDLWLCYYLYNVCLRDILYNHNISVSFIPNMFRLRRHQGYFAKLSRKRLKFFSKLLFRTIQENIPDDGVTEICWK